MLATEYVKREICRLDKTKESQLLLYRCWTINNLMKNNKLKELKSQTPGVFVSLVLALVLLLPSIIEGIAPRYYTGDPNFDVESFKQEALGSYLKNMGQIEPDMKLVLPPKVIPQEYGFISYTIIPTFGLIWALSLSIYAFVKRKTFKSKLVVWAASLTYLLFRLFQQEIIFWRLSSR